MRKSIINNAIFNALYQMINTLFPLVSIMYASRILMPEGIGTVAVAQNAASYFVTMAPLGVATYGVRAIAKSFGDQRRVNTRFWELFTINGISTLLFTALYYVYIGQYVTENRTLFLLCGIQILLNGIDIDWFYQGMEEYGYITLRNFVVKILSLAVLFLFVREKNDLVPYLLISIGATFGNRIFNVIYARKYIGLTISGFCIRQHLAPEVTMMLNSFLATVFNKVSISVLGYMDDHTSVGLFTNAHKLVGVILGLCASITASFLPRLSYYYASDRKKYTELINYGIQVLWFLALPAVVGVCLIAPQLMTLLFGAAFCSSASTVRCLSVLILVKSLGDLVCYQVLISAGMEKKQTPAYICGAVLNVALNLLLIPRLGPDGAAVAFVLAELLLNLLILRISRRIVPIRLFGKNTAKTVLAVLLMAAAVGGSMILCKGASDLVCVALAVAVGLAVYIGGSILLRNDITKDAIARLKTIRAQ